MCSGYLATLLNTMSFHPRRELLRGAGFPEGMRHSGTAVASSVTEQALKNCSFTLSLKFFYRGAALFVGLQTVTKMIIACYYMFEIFLLYDTC